MARANGDDLLADHLMGLYQAAHANGELLPAASALEDRVVRVAGVVTHAATAAAMGAVEVRVLDPLAHRELRAVTDANGLFVVDGVSLGATVEIVTEHAGYVPAGELLYVDPSQTTLSPMIGTRVYLQPDDTRVGVN